MPEEGTGYPVYPHSTAHLGKCVSIHNPQHLLPRSNFQRTSHRSLEDPVKFRAERDTLVEAIQAAGRATASRSSAYPVLAGLRLQLTNDHLEVLGSDLELTIRSTALVHGDADGTAVVEARLLTDIVKSLPAGAVSVTATGDELSIAAGRASFSVRTFMADEFPRLPTVSGNGVKVNGTALSEALRQVAPAASTDETRPTLVGILLSSSERGLRLVATDSYRLAVRDLPGVSLLEAGKQVLVAARGLREAQRVIGDHDVEVVLGERDVALRTEGIELTTRLLEDKFPNYQQLIPESYPNQCEIDRVAFAEAVKRIRLITQPGRDSSPIKLQLSADGVEVSATAQDRGTAQEPLDAVYTGSDLTVAFNSTFLLEGLDAIPDERVILQTLDPLKPATLRGSGSADYLYLIMPVRIV